MVWRGENVCLAAAKNRDLPEQGIHQFTKGDEETSVGFCTVDSRQLKMVSKKFPRFILVLKFQLLLQHMDETPLFDCSS